MRFENWQPPVIEHGKLTKWNWMVQHPENLKIGKKVDIGAFSYINALYGVELEDEVQVGSHCSIYSISTIDNKQAKVTIKKNSRIGSHSIIMPGVTIGENSIIGAHSFVNKDIPPNTIAFGIPAKIHRKIELNYPEKNYPEKDNLWKIPLFKTYSDQEDIDAVTQVIKRGTYWACGPEIEEFEKKVAEFVGTKYALSFNSGTSALLTLLLAYDVKEKEVIVPSFTFIATANAVILAGGIPVFAESEGETFGLDAEDVEKKITSKTKAIIPLHYGGFPSRDIEKLQEISNKYNLLLIDDAAESLGARIGNKKVGTFGQAAMFSLCQNKVISAGEGGMIVTDDKKIYEKTKLIRSHGRVEEAHDYFSSTGDNDYIEAGYNLRLPTILAALGISQLTKINKIVEMRRANASYLSKNISQIKEITIPKELPNHYSVYQMYTIILTNEKIRNDLQKHLAKDGIMSKVYFNPVHLKTIYKNKLGYKEGDLPKSEALSKIVLNIPLYPHMTQKELDFAVSSIKEFFEK